MSLMQNLKKLFQNKMGSSSIDLSNDDSGNPEKQTPTIQTVCKKLLKTGAIILLIATWNGTFLLKDSVQEDFPFGVEYLESITILLFIGSGLGIFLLVSALGIRNHKKWAFALGRISILMLSILIIVITSIMFFSFFSRIMEHTSILSSILLGAALVVFNIPFTLQFIIPLHALSQDLFLVEFGKVAPENFMSKFLEKLRKTSDEKTQAQTFDSLTWKPFVLTILSITILSLSTGPFMWGYNSFVANFDSRIKTVNEYTPKDKDDAPKVWHTVKVSESEDHLKEVYYCWTGDISTLYYVNAKAEYKTTSFCSSMILLITGVTGFILLILSRLGFNTFKVGIVLFMSTIGGGMLSMIAMSVLRILLGSSFGELP